MIDENTLVVVIGMVTTVVSVSVPVIAYMQRIEHRLTRIETVLFDGFKEARK